MIESVQPSGESPRIRHPGPYRGSPAVCRVGCSWGFCFRYSDDDAGRAWDVKRRDLLVESLRSRLVRTLLQVLVDVNLGADRTWFKLVGCHNGPGALPTWMRREISEPGQVCVEPRLGKAYGAFPTVSRNASTTSGSKWRPESPIISAMAFSVGQADL